MRAVVFDCDGVLVDSEPISEWAWTTVLARYGYTATEGDHAATRGMSGADTDEYYLRFVDVASGHSLLPEVDVERRRGFDERLEVFPDALTTVRALAAEGVPLAVATSSSRANLDIKLAMFDLDRYFDVTVAVDEVRRSKPAPDLYLAAAAGLALPPTSCLAIDDTDIGADSAVAAGLRTVQLLRDGSLSARHTVVSQLDPELVMHWLGLR